MALTLRILLIVAVVGAFLAGGLYYISARTANTSWLSPTLSAETARPAAPKAGTDEGQLIDAAPAADTAPGEAQMDLYRAEVRDGCDIWFVALMANALVAALLAVWRAEHIGARIGGYDGVGKASGVWRLLLLECVIAACVAGAYFYTQSRLPMLMGTDGFVWRAVTFGLIALAAWWLATITGVARAMRSAFPGAGLLP